MSANNDLQQKLRAGVEAARNGDRITARRLLEQVIAADDKNEMAWLWLASVVNTLPERRTCLEKVLQINPKNQRAQEALRRLEGAKDPSQESQRTRQTIDRLRGGASSAAPRRAAGPPREFNLSTSTLIFGGAILSVVVFALVLLSGGEQPGQPTPTSPRVGLLTDIPATSTITHTPTPTVTSTPVTPVSFADVTRFAPTLPATFTPTSTLTPTPTFTASPEPPGLEAFDVIYASLNSGADQPDLYIMRGDGTGESLFLDGGRDVIYSWDGTRIAFVRDVGGNPEIFVAPADDPGGTQQLTQLGTFDTSHPSWSPDNTHLIFSSSYQSDNPELWVIELQNNRLTRLTQTPHTEREPAWSPVSNVIAYSSNFDTSVEIYSITLNNTADAIVGTPVQLTNASLSSYSPAWSFDGQRIAFISDRSGDGDLFVMTAQGDSEVLLTPGDFNAEDRSPAFSPDGRWIFFLSNRNTDNFQIFAHQVGTFESFQVLDNGRNDQSVAFRP